MPIFVLCASIRRWISFFAWLDFMHVGVANERMDECCDGGDEANGQFFVFGTETEWKWNRYSLDAAGIEYATKILIAFRQPNTIFRFRFYYYLIANAFANEVWSVW